MLGFLNWCSKPLCVLRSSAVKMHCHRRAAEYAEGLRTRNSVKNTGHEKHEKAQKEQRGLRHSFRAFSCFWWPIF